MYVQMLDICIKNIENIERKNRKYRIFSIFSKISRYFPTLNRHLLTYMPSVGCNADLSYTTTSLTSNTRRESDSIVLTEVGARFCSKIYGNPSGIHLLRHRQAAGVDNITDGRNQRGRICTAKRGLFHLP